VLSEELTQVTIVSLEAGPPLKGYPLLEAPPWKLSNLQGLFLKKCSHTSQSPQTGLLQPAHSTVPPEDFTVSDCTFKNCHLAAPTLLTRVLPKKISYLRCSLWNSEEPQSDSLLLYLRERKNHLKEFRLQNITVSAYVPFKPCSYEPFFPGDGFQLTTTGNDLVFTLFFTPVGACARIAKLQKKQHKNARAWRVLFIVPYGTCTLSVSVAYSKHQYLAFDVSLPPPSYLSCSPKQLDSESIGFSNINS
jgi:hypothetical protein